MADPEPDFVVVQETPTDPVRYCVQLRRWQRIDEMHAVVNSTAPLEGRATAESIARAWSKRYKVEVRL